MISRTPERRKANRGNSTGRRIHRRFILESEIVVGVSLSGDLFSAANILDISMSGAYLLVGGIGKPEIDQIINISFSETQFVHPKIVQSKIKYINGSSLIGNTLYDNMLKSTRVPKSGWLVNKALEFEDFDKTMRYAAPICYFLLTTVSCVLVYYH